MKYKEALYVGCGNKEVTFKSNDATKPAKFYINSAPAYKQYVTQLITTDVKAQKAEPKKYALAISDHYGKMEDSNDRVVNQLIVKDVLERVKNGGTNQLQMGLTELAPGSVWNTMPAHTRSATSSVRQDILLTEESPVLGVERAMLGEVDATADDIPGCDDLGSIDYHVDPRCDSLSNVGPYGLPSL